jgi:flagellar biosynthesis chaperone FliJ
MINIDLTEEEYNLIVNYRKGKYNIDITSEEYQMIISNRNGGMKVYEKYIENIEKLTKEDNNFITEQACYLLEISNKLHNKQISLKEYKKLKDIEYTKNDEDVAFKINCLNYIKNAIIFHYPN